MYIVLAYFKMFVLCYFLILTEPRERQQRSPKVFSGTARSTKSFAYLQFNSRPSELLILVHVDRFIQDIQIWLESFAGMFDFVGKFTLFLQL